MEKSPEYFELHFELCLNPVNKLKRLGKNNLYLIYNRSYTKTFIHHNQPVQTKAD
jgi:hypothetical protein